MFNGSTVKMMVSTGLTVAGIGLAALAATPVYAGTLSSTTVGSSLTLSGLSASFMLSGAPATTQTGLSAVAMNVKSNNKTGYNVTVQAAAPTMIGAITGNTDTIPISALAVRNTTTGGAYTAVSNSAATTVANTTTKTSVAGDIVNNDFQMVIPWVNADTYSVTLNYIAANNP